MTAADHSSTIGAPSTAPADAGRPPGQGIVVDGIRKSFGDHDALAGVDLHVDRGTSLTLLGPSGCGKTTLLRVVAGLERPDRGTVTLDDRTLTRGADVVAPEHRGIGMVFQDWALFPHLDVAHNVGYGLDRGDDDRVRQIENALDMVGLTGFGDRMPATLSGGEQQRVAIARAIAPRPDALLMDEPFSNLDASLRSSVRSETRTLLRDLAMTTLFVTHDQGEAFVLGDEVAVMRGGRILQQAAPDALYEHPVDPWTAAFIGDANLLSGRAEGRRAHTAVGAVPLLDASHGERTVLVRPESLELAPGGSATVTRVEYYGHDCTYHLRIGGTEIVVRSLSAPEHRPGDLVTPAYVGGPTVTYDAT